MDIDLEHYKKLLEAKREELQKLVAIAEESTKPVELDQTRVGRLSRMDAMQGQAMALASERRRKDELVQIEKALKRIESGDYGYCISCDEPIAPKRLEFNPAVLTCINCASGKS
ncbi:MAG: TraR/DksA family transcriptional regulator [Alphaproteobacteria bacterium]|nr:TraR/DksA family transcriptional regulator [Alphaproteobacteria bacterium]